MRQNWFLRCICILMIGLLVGCQTPESIGETAVSPTIKPTSTATSLPPTPLPTSLPASLPTPLPTATPITPPTPTPTSTSEPTAASRGSWQQFSQAELETVHEENGRSYYPFLDEPMLQAGLYILPGQAADRQSPHLRDEVYFIQSGKAVLEVDEESMPVAEGDIIFVKAGVRHRFVEIEETLQTLVLFSAVPSDADTPPWLKFELTEILTERNEQQNVWHQFLSAPSLRFGMYMLPRALDGDRPLAHTFDEINVVINGRSTFQMDEDEVEIEPGSIIYVPAGISHHFHTLTEDVDVLILWNGQ